jgi:hypothetical protein
MSGVKYQIELIYSVFASALYVSLYMAYLRERKKKRVYYAGVQVGDPWSPGNRLQSEHKW